MILKVERVPFGNLQMVPLIITNALFFSLNPLLRNEYNILYSEDLFSSNDYRSQIENLLESKSEVELHINDKRSVLKEFLDDIRGMSGLSP